MKHRPMGGRFAALLLAFVCLAGCASKTPINSPPIELEGGASAIIYILSNKADTAIEWAAYRMNQVAGELMGETGEVARVNQAAGERLEASPLILYLIERINTLYSNGATGLAPVREAVGEEEWVDAPIVDLSAIEVDAEEGLIGVSTGVEMDFSKVYVGVAFDSAMGELKDRRIENAMLAAEGVCVVLGTPASGSRWSYTVPSMEDKQLSLMHIQLDEGAAATAVNLEGQILSATVVTDSALVAQALAQTCVTLSVDEAFTLLARFGAQGALADGQGIVHYSPALSGRVDLTQVEGFTLKMR